MPVAVRSPLRRAARTLGLPAAALLILFSIAGVALACVAPAEPTTTTTSLSGESKSGATLTVLEGSKIKDQATLEGKNAAKATGKISYAVYKDSSCKELVTKAGEFEFKEGKVPASEEKTLEGGKVYYWQAHYGGDSLDAESTSTCGGEVLSVKAATTISTSLSGEAKSGESLTVLEGSGVKDKASLGGTNSATATGKVKYKVYADSSCKELVASAGEGTLSGGSAGESEEEKLTAGAVYYWQASYEGDSLHQASTGACGKEVLTVKAATVISTSLYGGGESGEAITVPEGTKVKDSATLTGTAIAGAGGKVGYAVYADSECKELIAEAGEVTVVAGAAPSSEEKTLEAGRTYYWRATYGGDSLHQPAVGACGKEVENVKAATTISTSLSGEGKSGETLSVLEGTKVKDQATLSGTKSSGATGTVKYKVYGDSGCKELVASAGEFSVSKGEAPASEEVELEAGKVYYWQAGYGGDALHQPSTGACGEEVETVKAATALTTLLLGGTSESDELVLPDTEGASDTATLSGTNVATATGSVEYFVYGDSKCKELVAEAGEATVEEGEAGFSEEETLSPGTYYWQATYSGDSLHQSSTSACGSEVAEIKSATSVSTSLSGEGKEGDEIEVAEGAPVSDQATLGGAGIATAGGKVTYAVYADPGCEELVAEAGEATVEAGEAGPSEAETLPAGASYFWLVEYSGDGSHAASQSPCEAEVSSVTPTVTTTLSSGEESGEEIEVLEGAAITDQAALNGEAAKSATGEVGYAVYKDSSCKELATKAGESEIAGGKISPSEAKTLEAGTYYWQASYSGDKSHPAAKSECGAEVAEVVTPTSLTTNLSGGGESGAEITVAEGTEVTDTATLSGSNASSATGYVEYSVYSDSECEHLAGLGGDVDVEGASIPASQSQNLPAGTYYWQAVYTGDGVNQTSTSSCGSEVEVVTSPLTLVLTGEGHTGDEIEVGEGEPISGDATVHGEYASSASGTIEYNVYADSNCTELAAKAGKFEFKEGEKVPASEEETLSPGIEWWQAKYSGDAKNPKSTSNCELDDSQVVGPSKYAALGDSYSAGQGSGDYYPETDRNFWRHNLCHRTPNAWPARLAEAFYGSEASSPTHKELVFRQQPAQFIFRACSGAVTENLWAAGKPANGQWEEWIEDPPGKWTDDKPSQDLWLSLPGGEEADPMEPNPGIKLVTLTIGGNDAGFAPVLEACVRKSDEYCREALGEFEFAAPGKPGLRHAPGPQEGIPSISDKLPVVLTDIHERAPNAKIRLPLYPKPLRLLPRKDIKLKWGYKIRNTGPGVTVADALERYVTTLNSTIWNTVAAWAKAHGADAKVIPWTLTSLEKHRLGNAMPWINGIVGAGKESSFHPTCFGNLAIAQDLAEWFGVTVPFAHPCTE